MSDNAIEVQNLTKRYGQTTVVRGISFSVRRGEIFGLLGPKPDRFSGPLFSFPVPFLGVCGAGHKAQNGRAASILK